MSMVPAEVFQDRSRLGCDLVRDFQERSNATSVEGFARPMKLKSDWNKKTPTSPFISGTFGKKWSTQITQPGRPANIILLAQKLPACSSMLTPTCRHYCMCRSFLENDFFFTFLLAFFLVWMFDPIVTYTYFYSELRTPKGLSQVHVMSGPWWTFDGF